MDIAIRHRSVEVPDSVRRAVEEKLTHVGKFLDGMDRAEVRFHEERNPRISEREVCEVTMHGHGHIIRAKAAAPEVLTAVDRVVAKLEHRMEKLKGKLLGRSHPRRGSNGASNGKVKGGVVVDTVTLDDEDDLHFEAPGDTGEWEGSPRIVKTKMFAIKPMTPEEGAMQMDLLGHDFFLFMNAETGRAAVVYRRAEGTVGLIDT